MYSTMAVIEVKNLTKSFKKLCAVDGITFSVEKNEIFGLLGPNGSGKTTTQRMLATVLEPSSGIIKYHSKILNSTTVASVRREIGYVPQGECLYGDLTIEENLRFFVTPYRFDNNFVADRIEELLDLLQLNARRKELVKNLSGGLKRRASIAAALIHQPKILFLDEVTMGLDPNSRYHIWDLIRRLSDTTTIILTTHYMDEAEDLCGRIALLNRGKIMHLDSPENLIRHYGVSDLNQVMGRIIEEER